MEGTAAEPGSVHAWGEHTLCSFAIQNFSLCKIHKETHWQPYTPRLPHSKEAQVIPATVCPYRTKFQGRHVNNNVTLHLLLLPVLLTPCQILLLPLALLFWMLGRWGTQTPTCTEPLHFSPQRTFSPWHSIGQFYSQILHINQDTKMGSGEQLYLRIVESCQPESDHSQEVWYSRMDEQGERVGSL